MTERRFKGPVKTQQEIIVAYLWEAERWFPTHELMGVHTPYGFIGSAGHVRARELARNDCQEKLKNKVQRARGGVIGLEPKYEYFRYRQGMTREDHLEIARQAVKAFDEYEAVTEPRGNGAHMPGSHTRAASS